MLRDGLIRLAPGLHVNPARDTSPGDSSQDTDLVDLARLIEAGM